MEVWGQLVDQVDDGSLDEAIATFPVRRPGRGW
jgi:hypothetical protein